MQTAALTPAVKSPDTVRDLIRYIRSDGFKVGDRIPSIRKLSSHFEVSPNVIRDALLRVQTTGLIKILPRSGAFVQEVGCAPLVEAFTETLQGTLMQVDHNLFHLLEVRQMIEVECVCQAAKRRRLEDLLPLRQSLDAMGSAVRQMDSSSSEHVRNEFVEAAILFHLGIAKIGGNPVLATLLKTLLDLLRPHLAQIPWSSEREQGTQQIHEQLYEALVKGNFQVASECMERHLKVAYDILLEKVWARNSTTPRNEGDANGQ